MGKVLDHRLQRIEVEQVGAQHAADAAMGDHDASAASTVSSQPMMRTDSICVALAARRLEQPLVGQALGDPAGMRALDIA